MASGGDEGGNSFHRTSAAILKCIDNEANEDETKQTNDNHDNGKRQAPRSTCSNNQKTNAITGGEKQEVRSSTVVNQATENAAGPPGLVAISSFSSHIIVPQSSSTDGTDEAVGLLESREFVPNLSRTTITDTEARIASPTSQIGREINTIDGPRRIDGTDEAVGLLESQEFVPNLSRTTITDTEARIASPTSQIGREINTIDGPRRIDDEAVGLLESQEFVPNLSRTTITDTEARIASPTSQIGREINTIDGPRRIDGTDEAVGLLESQEFVPNLSRTTITDTEARIASPTSLIGREINTIDGPRRIDGTDEAVGLLESQEFVPNLSRTTITDTEARIASPTSQIGRERKIPLMVLGGLMVWTDEAVGLLESQEFVPNLSRTTITDTEARIASPTSRIGREINTIDGPRRIDGLYARFFYLNILTINRNLSIGQPSHNRLILKLVDRYINCKFRNFCDSF
ncbi:unnamed protein product [Mytilus coruscus]|uniref:Uncharacterized protein n=1 Tax=Mytilus coruscus TaxID=42192 RepID=A0A6J8F3M3_MYTCO|nr:unnamed protein product [Mytilus coruscus]